ncbi:MAG TPA: MlaE family lipid ABC transporter permease subunit [Parvibaculum sp.]
MADVSGARAEGLKSSYRFETRGRELRIMLSGEWVVVPVLAVDDELRAFASTAPDADEVVFDMTGVTRFDTAGTWVLERTAAQIEALGVRARFDKATESQQILFDKVGEGAYADPVRRPDVPLLLQILARIGKSVLTVADGAATVLGFFGEVVAAIGATIRHPSRLRAVPLVSHMERAGFDALPLVCLLTFLIGAVIAQQGASQLKRFGADVFTVNLVGIIFLREVGLLLTAIIVAGRSGSAFTAEIGSMKMREEIDAMRTLGLNPMDMLVVPRVLALVVTLPLLTFIGDIMGLVGGGVVALTQLHMSPAVYIQRLSGAVEFWTFGVGLLKAPFMAVAIAIVGCQAGLSVTGSAESVGTQTTRSVVASIFLVIVLDALFAMFFTAVGI